MSLIESKGYWGPSLFHAVKNLNYKLYPNRQWPEHLKFKTGLCKCNFGSCDYCKCGNNMSTQKCIQAKTDQVGIGEHRNDLAVGKIRKCPCVDVNGKCHCHRKYGKCPCLARYGYCSGCVNDGVVKNAVKQNEEPVKLNKNMQILMFIMVVLIIAAVVFYIQSNR